MENRVILNLKDKKMGITIPLEDAFELVKNFQREISELSIKSGRIEEGILREFFTKDGWEDFLIEKGLNDGIMKLEYEFIKKHCIINESLDFIGDNKCTISYQDYYLGETSTFWTEEFPYEDLINFIKDKKDENTI